MKKIRKIIFIIFLSFSITTIFMVFVGVLQSNQKWLDNFNNAVGFYGEQVSMSFLEYIKTKIKGYYFLIFPIVSIVLLLINFWILFIILPNI